MGHSPAAMTMSATDPFCLGCGTVLPTGSYRRLLGSVATRHVIPVWRDVLHTLLERGGLAIDEATVVNDKEGYIDLQEVFAWI